MIRAGVVTSSELLRAGIASVVEVAGSAANLEEAAELEADVLVIDWDQESAQELIEFAAESPPILVLADSAQPPWLAGALRAGIRGVLPRDAPAVEIAAAIEAAAAGLVVLHPDSVEAAALRGAPAPRIEALSPRETDVLRLIAEGASNKEIAWRLKISEHTVKFHVNSIFSKMNAGSRTEAVMLGLRRGLIPL